MKSDGGPTSYYELPEGARELNDLIEYKQMSFALGNIFKACYRYGEKDSASRLYDARKMKLFAERLIAIEERDGRLLAEAVQLELFKASLRTCGAR